MDIQITGISQNFMEGSGVYYRESKKNFFLKGIDAKSDSLKVRRMKMIDVATWKQDKKNFSFSFFYATF